MTNFALAIYEKKELSFQLCYQGFAHFNVHLRIVCPFFDVNSLDRQHSVRAHGERKVAQLKRQQFLSLDSHIIK